MKISKSKLICGLKRIHELGGVIVFPSPESWEAFTGVSIKDSEKWPTTSSLFGTPVVWSRGGVRKLFSDQARLAAIQRFMEDTKK